MPGQLALFAGVVDRHPLRARRGAGAANERDADRRTGRYAVSTPEAPTLAENARVDGVMHVVDVKGLLSSRNGMNGYRGARMAAYTETRAARARAWSMCLRISRAKPSPSSRREKPSRGKRKMPAGHGFHAHDSFVYPLESRKCHVRRALALAHRSGVGLTLMTWSARVVRDVDLLLAINQKTKCVVQMTLTTCDENVLSLLEKNATFPPPPWAGRVVPPPRVFPRPTVRRSGYAQHVPRLVSRMGKASRSCRYA